MCEWYNTCPGPLCAVIVCLVSLPDSCIWQLQRADRQLFATLQLVRFIRLNTNKLRPDVKMSEVLALRNDNTENYVLAQILNQQTIGCLGVVLAYLKTL